MFCASAASTVAAGLSWPRLGPVPAGRARCGPVRLRHHTSPLCCCPIRLTRRWKDRWALPWLAAGTGLATQVGAGLAASGLAPTRPDFCPQQLVARWRQCPDDAASCPPAATDRLFGSRADDGARGGDINLLVKSDTGIELPALMAARIGALLQLALADQPCDVLIAGPNVQDQAIHRMAGVSGVTL